MSDDIWLIESPLAMLEGEALALSVDWLGAHRVESPAAWVFKDGEDISDEVMAGEDEHQTSGRVMTLKRLTARDGDGGNRYLLLVQAEVDGNTQRRKCIIEVRRASRAV